LIAEEVANVDPDLVVRDDKGEIYTVRYDAVNAMLLNEFLKEHNKVEQQAREIQEQKNTISELKEGMDSVVAQLKEQESRIEKVSAQVRVSKKATKTIADNE
jgi:septal ring factor EnvC (AmiA/AmiB activator)